MRRAPAAVAGCALLLSLACSSASERSTSAPRSEPPGAAADLADVPAGADGSVTRHTDGDTLRVDNVKIRLIGINTPEITPPAECFGREAAEHLAAELPIGTRVRLVYDVERHDRFGRTLAYVYRLSDGRFINDELVRSGYATTLTVRPNVRHVADLRAAQQIARQHALGLWRICRGPGGVVTAG